jgi:hypothetical protein
MTRASDSRPIFVLRLRPDPNVDPVRALRAVLKSLLRTYGMKCIAVEEEESK